ncbi:hypothetical protein CLV78_10284 [Aliiruegeria haliotis]|uniref:Dihydroorotate dehydrogenase n=1 Tax=Aliiruegeria haliotis TaxID=1280846 RepID=A0A2T0RUQ4_9RHOB|nr:dihydroorotate dehydrogenase [Aliiruegeria haliotis]PRY24911.1 hypothetical protein CLV78_10284 [Aliiruegeria haliotis]
MTRKSAETVDTELETFFKAARDVDGDPSADLMARVLADAYEEQPAPGPAVTAPAKAPRRGWLSGAIEAMGGWPAMTGLAAATMAGVWIGYSPPLALETLSLDVLDSGYGLPLDGTLPAYDLLLADE